MWSRDACYYIISVQFKMVSMRYTPSLGSFPNVAFETAPLTMALLSRPFSQGKSSSAFLFHAYIHVTLSIDHQLKTQVDFVLYVDLSPTQLGHLGTKVNAQKDDQFQQLQMAYHHNQTT